jgi:hypothetical protein
MGILIFHCITGTLPFGRLGDSIEVEREREREREIY